MSSKRDRFKLAGRVASLGFIIGISATPSSAQFLAPVTYVCQTPAFWCAIQAEPGVPNGTLCYCNTFYGPVWGLSINPSGVSNAPQLPKPQPQRPDAAPPRPESRPGRTEPTSTRATEVAANDCYKGLGNCPGAFGEDISSKSKSGEANGIAGGKRTFRGDLAEGSSRRISFSLERGVSYTITGACDNDCDDLDFQLRRGITLVDNDTDSNDAPVVSVTPSSSGSYSLEVLMESCAASACSYTVKIEEN